MGIPLGNVVSLNTANDTVEPSPPEAPVDTASAPADAPEMPAEFTSAIATIDGELNGNLQALSAQVSQAERTQRETLKALDGLFERLAQRVQDQFQGVQRQCDVIKLQYDGA